MGEDGQVKPLRRKGTGRLFGLLRRGAGAGDDVVAELELGGAGGSAAPTADVAAGKAEADAAALPPPRPGATKRMPIDVLPKPREEWVRVIADEAYRIERLPAGPKRKKAEEGLAGLAKKLDIPMPGIASPPKPKGRPPTGKAKTASMHLRVSEEEKAPFAKLAAEIGAPPATVLRKMLIEAGQGGVELFKEDRDALVGVSRELAAIGRNLNQLARAANRHEPVSRSEVLAVTEPLEAEVQMAREEVRRVLERGKARRARLTKAAREGAPPRSKTPGVGA